MKTKTVIWIFLLVIFIVANQLHSTTLKELTLKDMCENSSDVVVARVVSTQSYLVCEKKRIYTKIELEVLKTLKGPSRPFEKLTFTMIGGTVNGITTVVVGAPTFIPDERTILFLSERRSKNNEKDFLVTGLTQGKFDVVVDSRTGIEKITRDEMDTLESEEGGSWLPLTNTEAISLQDFEMQISRYTD